MTPIERKARELLAAECRAEKMGPVATAIEQGMHVSGFADISLRAIAAALRLAVPEGMVMVPREPTREMVNAARTSDHWPSLLSGEAQAIYCAMLAAAPKPEDS